MNTKLFSQSLAVSWMIISSIGAMAQALFVEKVIIGDVKFETGVYELRQLPGNEGSYFPGMDPKKEHGCEVMSAEEIAKIATKAVKQPDPILTADEIVLRRAKKIMGIPVDGRWRKLRTTQYPYCTFAHLDLFFPYPIGQAAGSGFMVGPQQLLTAAHCVYDLGSQKWADNVVAFCGLNNKKNLFQVRKL